MEEKNVEQLLEEITTVNGQNTIDITPVEVAKVKPKKSAFIITFAILIGIIYAFATFWSVYFLVNLKLAAEGNEQLGAAIAGTLGWIVYVLIPSCVGLTMSISGLIVASVRLHKGLGRGAELALYIIYVVYPVLLNVCYFICMSLM